MQRDDAKFLDEAIVPEELAKVLDGKPKQQLVADFRADKHDDVLKLLKQIRGTKPASVKPDGARTLVTYEPPDTKKVTFVVAAEHVYIKN